MSPTATTQQCHISVLIGLVIVERRSFFVVFVVVVAAGDRQHAVRLDDAGGEQSEGN